MDRKSVEICLLNAGFILDDIRNYVYIVEKNAKISPAFIPNVFSRKGRLQIGGGIGLYFDNFEKKRAETLSREERKIDRSLPMIIAIDNFIELIDAGVFRTVNSVDEIQNVADVIYEKCLGLPNSVEDFSRCLEFCNILDKQVAQYIHYYSEVDDKNLYFSKSASFVWWLENLWPELANKIIGCLNRRTVTMMDRYRRDLF